MSLKDKAIAILLILIIGTDLLQYLYLCQGWAPPVNLYLRLLCWWNVVCFKHKKPLKSNTLGNWYCPNCADEYEEKATAKARVVYRKHLDNQDKLIRRLNRV